MAYVEFLPVRIANALLGLGLRGRLVVVGVNQVRDAAMRGTLVLAVVAGLLASARALASIFRRLVCRNADNFGTTLM